MQQNAFRGTFWDKISTAKLMDTSATPFETWVRILLILTMLLLLLGDIRNSIDILRAWTGLIAILKSHQKRLKTIALKREALLRKKAKFKRTRRESENWRFDRGRELATTAIFVWSGRKDGMPAQHMLLQYLDWSCVVLLFGAQVLTDWFGRGGRQGDVPDDGPQNDEDDDQDDDEDDDEDEDQDDDREDDQESIQTRLLETCQSTVNMFWLLAVVEAVLCIRRVYFASCLGWELYPLVLGVYTLSQQ